MVQWGCWNALEKQHVCQCSVIRTYADYAQRVPLCTLCERAALLNARAEIAFFLALPGSIATPAACTTLGYPECRMNQAMANHFFVVVGERGLTI